MVLSKQLALLAGSLSALVAPTSARAVDSSNPLAAVDLDAECRLPPVLDPSGDGLPESARLWGGRDALRRQVERHQAVVRVPSVCYDDLGPIDQDARWAPFDDLHRVLRQTYPAVHRFAKVERINTYGLLYTVRGSDPSLQPILLAAHQDVVPVQDESAWTHPPFAAHYDGQFLWGRGASDDKNSLTALLSTLETLLTDVDWRPRRTVLLALGFDEECSGYRGAARIADVLAARYGDDSVAVVLDEGGFGIQTLGDSNSNNKVRYALPSVTEKGHVDVWFALDVAGGHSSIPTPHTGIGIMAEIVVALEAHPYAPALTRESPVWAHMACLARHSPAEMPAVTELVRAGDVDGLAAWLDAADEPALSFMVRTSQAVDMIRGGAKINALPETVTLGVNYRVTLDDGIPKVLANIAQYVAPIAEKYNLSVAAFDHDEDYQGGGGGRTGSGGTLTIRTAEVSQPAPVSPMRGKVWDTFSGSAQYTLRFDGTVVPVGETMTGNTDTRHYQNLSPNIYRFTPAAVGSSAGIHTVDERVDMREHMKMLAFYYDFIRNFDRAVLDGEPGRQDNEEL